MIALETATALAVETARTRPAPESSVGTASRRSRRPVTVPGRRLGRYRLVERLGQGCQGEVWRAAIDEPRTPDVALKVLPPALARDPKRRAQFRREAERGARLAGPALLPTSEFGEADGLVFMAMPLIDGCTLGEVVTYRRGTTSGQAPRRLHRIALATEATYTRDVVRILERVARTMAGVHAAGVVHRDIKPANILLDHRRDDLGFLCDFGLGRDLDVATPAQMRDGAGTPLYMPPERLLRHVADEVLCDVYALGATLFEAVTLTPPLPVPDGLDWRSWTYYLATTVPPRPSTVRGTTPAALEAVILKAIARRPEDRYPTAAALAADLRRFLAGAPVRARSPVESHSA